MHALRTGTVALSALLLVTAACNAILGNEPGQLAVPDQSATEPPIVTEPTHPPANAGAASDRTDDGNGEEESGGVAGDASDGGADGDPSDAGVADADATADDAIGPPVVPPPVVPPPVVPPPVVPPPVLTCAPGFADCNGSPTDGCEADLSLPTSCGACGFACPKAAHAEAACFAGICGLTCVNTFADCNLNLLDGCEADLAKDEANCGACGNWCLLGRCVDGICRLP